MYNINRGQDEGLIAHGVEINGRVWGTMGM
jgi:hypothetical protein